MRSILPLALLGLLVAGCDSGGPDPDPDPDPDPLCGTSGLSSGGTFSATVDGAAFAPNCFGVEIVEVTSAGGTIDALVVTGSLFENSASTGRSFSLVTGTPATGTYSVEDRDVTASAAEAEYVESGTTFTAQSGSVTISQYSTSRVVGTFNVELDDGGGNAAGSFDITY